MRQIKERYRYSLIILKELVKTDFKLRYQNSLLGYVWSLLRPLALFTTLYLVFTKFIRIGDSIPHYPVYLLTGIVLWNYFAEITSNGVGSIVGKGDLLRKINFPKFVIVLAGSVSATINLSLNAIIIIVFMVLVGVDIHPLAIIVVPFLLIELFVFALALAFFLGAFFVKLRDVNYIWELIMQAAFYATPILYPLNIVPPKYAKILLLNPVAQIMQDIRAVIITPETQTIGDYYHHPWIRLVPITIVIIIAILSALYFRKHSKSFAEDI